MPISELDSGYHEMECQENDAWHTTENRYPWQCGLKLHGASKEYSCAEEDALKFSLNVYRYFIMNGLCPRVS